MKLSRRSVAPFTALALFGVCAFNPVLADQPAVALDTVRESLLEATSRIHSLRFTYRGEDAYRNSEDFPLGTFPKRIVAASRPYYYFHETAHGSDALPWSDDIRRRRCVVMRDRVYDYWVNDRAFNETPQWSFEAPLPGSMPGEPVMLAVGIWPLTSRPAPRRGGHPIMLVDVAKDLAYVLSKQTEVIADRSCHVLTKEGVDQLWLDLDRGCSLIARDLYDLKTGRRFLRHELGDHREIEPGIWMPGYFRTLRYHHHAENADQQDDILSDLRFKIMGVSINDVPDSLFEFEETAGMLCLNRETEQGIAAVQTVSAGHHHLDHLVQWANRSCGFVYPTPPTSGNWWYPAIGLAIAGLAIEISRWWRVGHQDV